jgi:hypothetical protein
MVLKKATARKSMKEPTRKSIKRSCNNVVTPQTRPKNRAVVVPLVDDDDVVFIATVPAPLKSVTPPPPRTPLSRLFMFVYACFDDYVSPSNGAVIAKLHSLVINFVSYILDGRENV